MIRPFKALLPPRLGSRSNSQADILGGGIASKLQVPLRGCLRQMDGR